jgi:cytochrome c oxidase subunit I
VSVVSIAAPEAARERAESVAELWRLELSNFGVALGAFGLGAVMAVMQSLARADLPVWFSSPKMYYISVTAHGVLMALVFTTFFIMGLGYVVARTTLGRLDSEGWGWLSFWVAAVGTAMAALAILSGSSTVLYTFYPPLQAHPTFYIGATLLIVGSWIWCGVMLRTWILWRRDHREPVPLPMHGMLVTVMIWILATIGLAIEVLVQLIPWSLGLVERIDPIVARTFFWWFGHPLVYFWLLPAYVLWYSVLPRIAGGKVFSDTLTRAVFVMFVLFSTPVGFHHQFADPGIPASWKMVHTVLTYAVLFPSMITAFSVIASLEVAGRLRGGEGLFGWVGKLPWRDPFFLAVALAMITFAFGGIGGAINAAYAMNVVVHNTAFIQAHFHLTVGTAVALTFMGATYWLLPRLTGRELALKRLALAQSYLWFFGMVLFSWTTHITGLMGQPRRVFSSSFLGAQDAGAWRVLTAISAVGGVVLFASAGAFLLVVVATLGWGRRISAPAVEYAEALDELPVRASVWDRLGLWMAVAALLVVLAYGWPLWHLLSLERFGSPGFKPF